MRQLLLLAALLPLAATRAAAGFKCTATVVFTGQSLDCEREKCWYRQKFGGLKSAVDGECKAAESDLEPVLMGSFDTYVSVINSQSDAKRIVDEAQAPANCSGCEYCIDYAREREGKLADQIKSVNAKMNEAKDACRNAGRDPEKGYGPACAAKLTAADKAEASFREAVRAAASEGAGSDCAQGATQSARQAMDSLASQLAQKHNMQLERLKNGPCDRTACRNKPGVLGSQIDLAIAAVQSTRNLDPVEAALRDGLAAFDSLKDRPEVEKDLAALGDDFEKRCAPATSVGKIDASLWPKSCK